jgi:hypothetical protein
MATLIAIPIGGGICFASGLTSPQLVNLVKRLVLGFVGGFGGGLVGILLGSCIFSIFGFIAEKIGFGEFIGRTLGWALIGIGIGVGIGASEGFVDRSFKKLRNGVIGGVLGGFLGGLTFYPVSLIASDMSSRALSFVLLGLAIGFFVGLAQVVLKEAWLTVEAGFRPGRQMILGGDLITMGTSEKSSIIFIAVGAKGVEPTHLKIQKQPDGRFLLEDNQSRTGTFLNGQPISGPTPLNDGDAIQFGINIVRFRERAKHGDAKLPPPIVAQPSQAIQAAPPKPVSPIQATPPKPVSPVQATPPKVVSPVQAAAPKPVAPVQAAAPTLAAPKPAEPPPKAAPKPPAQPQEGRCPICDKKIVGIPGSRRCNSCFTTF